jgi:hypothetical protein
LSPVLYSIFINDLKGFLATNAPTLNLPFTLATEFLFDDIDAFVHLFLLLYADDAVILTETQNDMQCALKLLKSYCDNWSLTTINVQKTKVLIFSKRKIRKILNFFLVRMRLGLSLNTNIWGFFLINYNNSFVKAIKERCAAANRAMFLLLKRCRNAHAFTRCYCMAVKCGSFLTLNCAKVFNDAL